MNRIISLALPTVLLAFLWFTPGCAQKPNIQNPIRLNQIRFYPHATKLAVVENEEIEGAFYLLETNGKDTVYKAALSKKRTLRSGCDNRCLRRWQRAG